LGVFPWGKIDVYVMCSGINGFDPVLYKTNRAAAKPVFVRGFSNLNAFEATGVVGSSSRDFAYINFNDENADLFLSLGIDPGSAGITLANPTLSEIVKTSYIDRPIITGGGTRGTTFIGDPAVLNRTSDPINDRFVTTISADGGPKRLGALLTYDRLQDKVLQFDLGFDNGGFPFGRLTEVSSGDYFFSVASYGAHADAGTTFRYDASQGMAEVVAVTGKVKTGIGVVEAPDGLLYGLGVDKTNSLYFVYSIDPSDLAYKPITNVEGTNDDLPQYEIALNGDNLWFFTPTQVHCLNPLTSAKSAISLTSAGPNTPVRAISFKTAGADGFFATKSSAVAGSGTIQRITNNCAAPSLTTVVSGLTDTPSTALLAASDGYFYYGTQSGKLMRFDGISQVIEVADIINATNLVVAMVGFLTEDANGDIIGFASNGNPSEDILYAYTISTGALIPVPVPKTTPIDTHYPGVTEVK
ncbi:MAG: hypothetical protein ACRCT7_10205, partial [Shewanella sp.]